MAKIIVNGKACAFEGKKNILQVALDGGVEIPHYCYHPGLSVVASCRICLAEVEQPDPKTGKLSLQPRLFPTCQTPAVDGMVVHTQTPKAIANQKSVMEFLLINHPLDCPVCDQAGECHLQDYSYQYGRAESRFQEDKAKKPVKDVGPHVKLYSDRCIMCTRCVRFTREVTGTAELSVFGRGHTEQIDVFPGVALDNELSGNVVDICPVGALLDKDFLFTQRVWFLKEAASVDGLTSSGDNLWVHHNEGKVYRVKPRANLAANQWWISDEVRYGWKFVHSPDRLNHPTREQAGERIALTWRRATEIAGQGLRQVVERQGPGSLALMASPMLASEEAYLLAQTIRAIDPAAILAVGPVPTQGQDKTFPGKFTIRAEKAPNARGVRRALGLVAGDANVLDDAGLLAKLNSKDSPIVGLILTGNHPSAWATPEHTKAVGGKRFTVLLDTLPNDLSDKATLTLPAATWLEKAGCFESAAGLTQAFEQAIDALEGVKPEGQIALDLLTGAGLAEHAAYDAAGTRERMGEPFAKATLAKHVESVEPAMAYVAL